jgi:hypothetical protein
VNDSPGFDLAEIRAQMSPIGQEALDAAVARLLLQQAQDRIAQLERQKAPSAIKEG